MYYSSDPMSCKIHYKCIIYKCKMSQLSRRFGLSFYKYSEMINVWWPSDSHGLNPCEPYYEIVLTNDQFRIWQDYIKSENVYISQIIVTDHGNVLCVVFYFYVLYFLYCIHFYCTFCFVFWCVVFCVLYFCVLYYFVLFFVCVVFTVLCSFVLCFYTLYFYALYSFCGVFFRFVFCVVLRVYVCCMLFSLILCIVFVCRFFVLHSLFWILVCCVFMCRIFSVAFFCVVWLYFVLFQIWSVSVNRLRVMLYLWWGCTVVKEVFALAIEIAFVMIWWRGL